MSVTRQDDKNKFGGRLQFQMLNDYCCLTGIFARNQLAPLEYLIKCNICSLWIHASSIQYAFCSDKYATIHNLSSSYVYKSVVYCFRLNN